MNLPPDHKQLFEEARRYEELGDVYHATKLYKRVIKLAPDWVDAYAALGSIYFWRKEWKPCFHYCKKAVAIQPDLRDSWWQLGMAAYALKKPRLARSVWAKFGMLEIARQPEGLRLVYNNTFEILWMQAVNASAARIMSIPHPDSGFRFRDLVLYNRQLIGHHIVAQKRVPVYDEMGVFKRSPYDTYSCLIHHVTEEQIKQLEKLCYDARLGFEVWSNAARGMVVDNPQAFPEFYGRSILPSEESTENLHEHALIAIAAIHQAEVIHVLDAWQVIALGQYSDLRCYQNTNRR